VDSTAAYENIYSEASYAYLHAFKDPDANRHSNPDRYSASDKYTYTYSG
jgi:hypothetical protein